MKNKNKNVDINNINKLGLYIHIPFCKNICNYCDFFKMVVSDEYQNQYIDYLIKDLEQNVNEDVDTIYIGGGTPSSLSINNLERLLQKINNKVKLEKVIEYTIELNPEDIDYNLIKVLRKYNINRISIGVQTFNPRLQKILNRYSYFEDILEKMNLLRLAGFTNINVDLMYGIADQTLDELKDDLEKICLLRPTHISTYSLILEEKTILYHRYLKGEYVLADEDLESSMYYKIISFLESKGFIQYEISNFAYESNVNASSHNLIYWNNGEYLAIGAGASGYYNNCRYKITTKIKDYYLALDNNKKENNKQKMYIEYYQLDKNDKMYEEIMLGLRKCEGVSMDLFLLKYQENLLDVYPNCLELIKNNFLEIVDGKIRITKNNYYISNAIIGKIL